jgi:hypothetical protein
MKDLFACKLRGALGAATVVVAVASGLPTQSIAQQVDLAAPVPVLQDPLAAPAESPTTSQQDFESLMERLDELETQVDEELKAAKKPAEKEKPKKKGWFEKYTINGYAQLRINETVDDRGPAAPQHNGDSSIGDDQSFLLRRARLVLSGDVNDHVSIYLQPDFASSVPGSPDANHFVQIRDWYADIYLDSDRVHRLRAGQSKIPYGWENMQSSRNRLPLDRNDALNSAAKNERDLGIFYYWTPKPAQDFFDKVMDEGLKGSGNYGVFGLGFYNGQGGSFREQNDNLHFISRLTIPYTFENGQMMEVGIQGYTGEYVVLTSNISPLGVGPAAAPAVDRDGVLDERLAFTFVYYPQPIGFQSEWTVGRGPELNDTQTAIIDRSLYGGYAMVMYRHETEHAGEWLPFVRWSYYDGGYKSERNAPDVLIDEWELGCEWQITDAVEFVSMYTITDRTNTRAISTADTLSYQQFRGDLLRFQLQVKY